MSLIKCRECGNQVSNEATACPRCGAPQLAVPPKLPATTVVQHQPPQSQKKGIGFFSGCLILFLCLFIMGAIIAGINQARRDTPGAPTTSAPQFSSAPSPTGFRNFNWGDSPDGTLKQTASHPDGTTMYVPPDGTKPEPLFDIPVTEEAFYFSHGRFYGGDAWLDGADNFESMKAELKRRFGEPFSVNERNSLWKWKWQEGPIEVSLNYQARFARTTVTFENKKY